MRPGNAGQDTEKIKEPKKEPQDINLPMNNNGYPVLPSWEIINRETHGYKQRLIGKFMGEMYSEQGAVSLW